MYTTRLWSLCLLFLAAPYALGQTTIEFPPEDAFLISIDLPSLGENDTMKLLPGVFMMENQLRFNNNSPVIEGSGSGFGEEATVLDFSIFSANEEDARALSVRGGVTIRNLTIINVGGRVADLRTGTINSPSNAPVVFENVWFVNNNTGLKSTGGRTVGTEEVPMIVRHCVFANAADLAFQPSQQAVTLRDTSYAIFDHCDFFNFDELLHSRVDDPAAAPNEGPNMVVTNSILLGADGSGGSDTDDIFISEGKITIENSVLWDAAADSEVEITGGLQPEINDSISADPQYVNVTTAVPAADLNFALQAASPAIGLAINGLNAGSVAAEPVEVKDWSVF